MTRPIPGTNRQHRILKTLVAHGPLSLPGIRARIPGSRHEDLRVLRSAGYIEEAGMVPAGPASPIKELPSFKATPKGVAFAAVIVELVVRGPGKLAKSAEYAIRRPVAGAKSTTKLVPTSEVEITYTDKTKYTKYEPKYSVEQYQPPKKFMECVR